MMLAVRNVRCGLTALPAAAIAILAVALWITPAQAQLNLEALNNGPRVGATDGPPVTLHAQWAVAAGHQPATLYVTAKISPGWHIYSLTQKSGGPVPSKVTVEGGAGYKVTGPFTPLEMPEVKRDPAFDGLEVETHEGTAVWTAPLQLPAGVDASTLAISGKFSYQACDDGHCLPPTSIPFKAALVDRAAVAKLVPVATSSDPHAADAEGVYKSSTAHVTIRGHIEPRSAQPGSKARLVLTAEPSDEYHIYAYAEKEPKGAGPRPTLIALTAPSGWKSSPAQASGDLIEKDSTDTATGKERYYDKPVTWTIEVNVPKDAKLGTHKLSGGIGFQTCLTGATCDFPQGAEFSVDLPVAEKSQSGQLPLLFTPAKSYKVAGPAQASNAAAAGFDPTKVRPVGAAGTMLSLPHIVLYGFLGGLILNLMPCVLPVIGLKILSFVEQSHHDRKHVFMLNVWYSVGILAVFMALATLPVASHLLFEKEFGWGQQFAYDGFNITLTAIVFVMALSFLGVWEIPIPGFVGGAAANQLAAKEGALGAISKGAITTVLATPCSGPFLTTALAFAVAQSPHVTYTVFAAIGLGMASPYLLIGAFPSLIRFLPKPGAWMDTFKQLMGFVLLGTVVYLMTLVRWPAMVPTLTLLIGLWAGCWWIGRTPGYAELGAKAWAWCGGALIATAVGLFAFLGLGPVMAGRFELAVDQQIAQRTRDSANPNNAISAGPSIAKSENELPWQPYTAERLKRLTSEGKTVMVDFTADWCATCKTLEKLVLNTSETRELVNANGVVPLIVDMTRYPEEEALLLKQLSGGQSVPVLAIFPAGRPNEPIVFGEGYTKGKLLDALHKAGPSQGIAAAPEADEHEKVGMTATGR